LDEDEVFVIDEFFNSLLYPAKYPMFTCTCGIFGCGGYYVEVRHVEETVIWQTEQHPFSDKSIKSSNKFIFPLSNIIDFAEELVRKLAELRDLMLSHGLDYRNDLEKYEDIIQKIRKTEKHNNV
jgi:hypothetical protein